MRWPGGERIVDAVRSIRYWAENDGQHSARSRPSDQEQPILVRLAIDDEIGMSRLLYLLLCYTMSGNVRKVPFVPDKVAEVEHVIHCNTSWCELRHTKSRLEIVRRTGAVRMRAPDRR